MSEVKPIPDGYQVVTPYIQVHDTAAAIGERTNINR